MEEIFCEVSLIFALFAFSAVKFLLSFFRARPTTSALFENDERRFICMAVRCLGNPVKVGDGCATVTGYELPQPLVQLDREGGSEVEARSQDTGRIALVGSSEG